jgi:exodeoxyribonuclease VII large subunit
MLKAFHRKITVPVSQQTLFIDPASESATPSNSTLSDSSILLDQSNRKIISLSTLMGGVSKKINDGFPDPIWVQAEIVECKKMANGNYYLDLIERDIDPSKPKAKIRANMWSKIADRLIRKFQSETNTDLRSGINVLLKADVSMNAVYGFSLNIIDIDPTFTVGSMATHVAKIKKQLREDGIFLLNHELPIPLDLFRIAVVAPDGAAGLGDFKKEADILERYKVTQFLYFSATFQGDKASSTISSAIEMANECEPDIIIILRGGGGTADLQYLNDYEIAKSICIANVAVIIGVGHEKDKTILDEVAAVSCGTPSKVIGYISSILKARLDTGRGAMTAIRTTAENIVAKKRERTHRHISQIQSSSILTTTKKKQMAGELMRKITSGAENSVSKVRIAANGMMGGLARDATRAIVDKQKASEMLFREISGMRPEKTLTRGFALARTTDGKILTSAKDASNNSLMHIEFHDGLINVKVEK